MSWGGKRPGAGRKAGKRGERLTLVVSPSSAAQYRRLRANGVSIRAQLENVIGNLAKAYNLEV